MCVCVCVYTRTQHCVLRRIGSHGHIESCHIVDSCLVNPSLHSILTLVTLGRGGFGATESMFGYLG